RGGVRGGRLGGRLLAAALITAAVAVPSAAYAVSWDNVTPYVNSGQSTTGLQKLVYTPEPAANTAAIQAAYDSGKLAADGAPGLAQVYAHTNHQMHYKTDSVCANARSAISAADAKYTLAAWCFDGDEESSNTWLPQAVTSSQDAEQKSGYSAGSDQVVSLWRQEALDGNRARCPGVPSDTGRSVGLRATFIQRPYTDDTHEAFRHVLLVDPDTPNGNGLTYTPICDVHGGGIAWYGKYLFVSRHGSGVMVFDTEKTYLVPDDVTCGANKAAPVPNDVGQVGNSDGTEQLCAAGYRYVMFEVGAFHTSPSGCATQPTTLTDRLCFSSLSLQWSDDSLVTTEYRGTTDMTASKAAVRIVNWSTADLLDRISTGSGTPVTATKLASTNFEGIQGVVQRPNEAGTKPQYFIARTLPGGHGSELWYEEDSDSVCAAQGTYVNDTESMSYWVDSDGNGHLWTLTEYGNTRMLVRVYTNEYNDPPSGCPTQ
ncbi:MAG: hypothetical protein WCA46_01790, partial [Actinocatenispora sp.]